MARPSEEEDAALSKEGRKEGKTNHLYGERGRESACAGKEVSGGREREDMSRWRCEREVGKRWNGVGAAWRTR